MKNNILILSLIATVLGLSYCTSSTNKKTTQKQAVLEELPDTINVDEMNYFRFPSPKEIFSFIKEENIQFKPGIVNDYHNYNKYINSRQQALNLGIYVSDLAYLTVFNKQEDTYNYLTTVHTLCAELKISAAFTDEYLKKVQKNIDNADSLISLSDEAYHSIVNYLVTNDKEDLLALISIGTYIESMYLSMNFIQVFTNDTVLTQKIADQKYPFENLYAYAKQKLTNKSDNQYIEIIGSIQNVFDKIRTKTVSKTKVDNSSKDMLIFSGGSKLDLTEDLYNELNEKIKEERNKIIN
ncbi:MAG: hypothetical protein GXO79_03595 [Chlorobi bacterium]|nr:hypothetical protein [Chlorobiota bacterium]